MKQHDWRLFPVAVGMWVGAALGTAAASLPVVVAAVAGPIAGFALWRRRPWISLGLVACALMTVLAGILAAQREQSTLAELAADGAIVRIEVELVAEPTERAASGPMPKSAYVLADAHRVEGRGLDVRQRLPVLLTASGDDATALQELALGATYLVSARLTASEPTDATVAIVRITEVQEELRPAGPLHRVALGLRQGLRDAVAESPAAQRALVPSLVVGDTGRVDQAMEEDFRATGLTHLMAVSGANLALMLGVILAVLRVMGVRGWTVRCVAVGGVGMFVIVCGPEPSVQRAAVMGLVALGATGVGKGRRSVRALSVAIVVLITLDPWLSRAPGFWLSVAACFGIVLLGPPWMDALTRWAPRWFAEALAIPLSAQIATQPIVTALNGEVSLVGVLANALAGPFVGPTTVLGFAAACLSPLPPLSSAAGWAAGWAAQPILWIAEHSSQFPASVITWIPGAPGIVLIAALCISLALLLSPVLRRLWACLLALAVLAAGIVVRVPNPAWPGPWQVAFCDVGQGDATVIRVDAASAVLIDAGPEPGPVLACLDALGVKELPMVVLTHYHSDHIGGFSGVARRYVPSLVLVSALASPADAAEEVALAAQDAVVRPAAPGEVLEIGPVTWATVSNWVPPFLTTGGEGESGSENDASVVGVAQVGELRVLLAGDTEPAGQREAMRSAEALGLSLEAQVLKIPHHGSSRQDETFFDATNASLAVASSGEDNGYGHPAPAVLELARAQGMGVARTDTDGSVALSFADGSVRVRRAGK